MLARLTSRQVAEWMAYFQLEPWGEHRADLRAGIVAATVANVHRGKDARPHAPTDFMPDFEPEDADTQSAQLVQQLAAALSRGKGNSAP